MATPDFSPLFTGRHTVPTVVAALLPHLDPAPHPPTLYSNLPSLCSWLFGSPTTRGVIHGQTSAADEAALAQLLRPPSGALFRAVLSLAGDSSTLYEVQIQMLPKPTQSVLDAVERSELPNLLRTRVSTGNGFGSPSSGNASGLYRLPVPGDGSHVIGPATGEPRIRIKFTICEYYIFCCLLAGTTFPTTVTSPAMAFTAQRPSLPPMPTLSGSLTGLASPTTAGNTAAFYLDLFSAHARFFLPTEFGRSDSLAGTAGPRRPSMATLVRSVSFFNRGPLQQTATSTDAEPSIFSFFPSQPPDMPLAISEFFADAFSELFLGQNPLVPSASPGPVPLLKDPYVKPPLVVIKAAGAIVKMLMPSEVNAVEAMGSARAGAREPVQNVARKRACMAIKWKLYSFLRLAFVFCPEEEYFDQLSKLYTDYLAPWSANGRYDASYHPLLADRLLFYTSLLRTFLERAGKAEPAAVLAQLRSPVLLHIERRLWPDIVSSVIGALSSPPDVLDTLRALEQAAVSSQPPRTPSENEARLLMQAAMAGWPPSVKQFEGGYRYSPVWAGGEMSAAARVAAVLAGALRLLEQGHQAQQPAMVAPPAASPGSTATSLATMPGSPTDEDIAARLHAALDLVHAAFGLPATEDPLRALRAGAEGPEERRIAAAAPDEDADAVSAPASKFLPHLAKQKQDGQLTARGKYLVRHGLAKTSNLDVPIVPEDFQDPGSRRRRERMVGDQESAVLVALMAAIGNGLHAVTVAILLALADRYPDLKLPVLTFRLHDRPHLEINMVPAKDCAAKVSFRWLRWFASYPNLVLLALIFIGSWFTMRVLWILFKVLRFMFSAREVKAGGMGGRQSNVHAQGGRGAYLHPNRGRGGPVGMM